MWLRLATGFWQCPRNWPLPFEHTMRGHTRHNSFWPSHTHTHILHSHTYILLSHTYIFTLAHIHSPCTYIYVCLWFIVYWSYEVMMTGGQLLPLGHILATIRLPRDSLVKVSSSVWTCKYDVYHNFGKSCCINFSSVDWSSTYRWQMTRWQTESLLFW